MEIVPEKTKNNVRKGRNAAFQYFLLFPQSFQTAFSSGESKVFIVWLRVYSTKQQISDWSKRQNFRWYANGFRKLQESKNRCTGHCRLHYNLSYIKSSVKHNINPFQHNDTFICPWKTSLLKTLWEKEKLLVRSTMFSTRLDNFLPFLSNLKLSSANSFSLEESKICRVVMG